MPRTKIAAACGLVIALMLACSAPMLSTPTPVPTETPTASITPSPTATATSTPMPVMIGSGLLEIPQTYQADLDSGVVPRDPKSPAYADVDLWFNAISERERYLEAYNGAAMLVMGSAPVGVTECQHMQASVARVDVLALAPGTYICFQTNIGNSSIVRVYSIDAWSPGTMRLEYQTWHQP